MRKTQAKPFVKLGKIDMTESKSSSLDNIETTGRFSLPPSYQAFATHFIKDEWFAVLEIYQHLDDVEGRRRAERLGDCRKIAWFVRNSETGKVRVSANHCHLRWCPLCGAAKKTLVAHELEHWLPKVAYPKMLTLTLLHSDDALTDQINHLYSSFRKLRKSRLLTKNVPGGVWFFQITYNHKTHTWHPHLHCLVTGKYISRGKISRLWLKITESSKIINIKMVKDFESAAHEVARYVARPGRVSNLAKEQRIELFTAMHGRRICGTWGEASTLSLSRPKQTEPGEWIRLGRWNTIRRRLDTDLDAQDIYQAWKSGTVLAPDVTMIEYENIIDNCFEMTKPDPPPPLLWGDPI